MLADVWGSMDRGGGSIFQTEAAVSQDEEMPACHAPHCPVGGDGLVGLFLPNLDKEISVIFTVPLESLYFPLTRDPSAGKVGRV